MEDPWAACAEFQASVVLNPNQKASFWGVSLGGPKADSRVVDDCVSFVIHHVDDVKKIIPIEIITHHAQHAGHHPVGEKSFSLNFEVGCRGLAYLEPFFDEIHSWAHIFRQGVMITHQTGFAKFHWNNVVSLSE